jgi:hypothetical protein|tara:strand:+ start:755 stop:1504 length:750 start_codon:yes stop_codon:yes gene_type:complete
VKIISLGAGVQSTTLALLAHHREIEPPDYAVFSDTGWEPEAVYKHLDWLESYLNFPVVRVSAGNLKKNLLDDTREFVAVPFFTSNGGMGRRQCTYEYKIRPLQKFCKPHASKGNPVISEIGISTDEWTRMKPSRVKYIENTWPLIDLNMSRNGCKDWLKDKGYIVPPKSSCLGCPFHNDELWRDIKIDSPEEFEETCKVDDAIRDMPKSNHQQFMHRSCKPLRDVDLRTMEEMGQLNFFDDECEGMCGL